MTAKGKCKRRSATFSFCSRQTMNEWWLFSTFNSRLSFGARIFIVTRTMRAESLRVENTINWLKKYFEKGCRSLLDETFPLRLSSTCLVNLLRGMLWMEHHQRQKLSTKTATLPRQHFLAQSVDETMAFRTRWRQLSCWLHNLIFHILCFGDEEIVNFSINIVSNKTSANVVLYAFSWLKCLSKKLTEWLKTCSKKFNRLEINSRKFYGIPLCIQVQWPQ